MTALTRITFPLDLDAITARAEAAPACPAIATTDSLWIDWHDEHDDEHDPGDYCGSGRWITVTEHWWHTGTGSAEPGPELWEFLAAARDDVLALAAEVRRLRARPGEPAARKDAA
jgi:hypothetical protein